MTSAYEKIIEDITKRKIPIYPSIIREKAFARYKSEYEAEQERIRSQQEAAQKQYEEQLRLQALQIQLAKAQQQAAVAPSEPELPPGGWVKVAPDRSSYGGMGIAANPPEVARALGYKWGKAIMEMENGVWTGKWIFIEIPEPSNINELYLSVLKWKQEQGHYAGTAPWVQESIKAEIAKLEAKGIRSFEIPKSKEKLAELSLQAKLKEEEFIKKELAKEQALPTPITEIIQTVPPTQLAQYIQTKEDAAKALAQQSQNPIVQNFDTAVKQANKDVDNYNRAMQNLASQTDRLNIHYEIYFTDLNNALKEAESKGDWDRYDSIVEKYNIRFEDYKGKYQQIQEKVGDANVEFGKAKQSFREKAGVSLGEATRYFDERKKAEEENRPINPSVRNLVPGAVFNRDEIFYKFGGEKEIQKYEQATSRYEQLAESTKKAQFVPTTGQMRGIPQSLTLPEVPTGYRGVYPFGVAVEVQRPKELPIFTGKILPLREERAIQETVRGGSEYLSNISQKATEYYQVIAKQGEAPKEKILPKVEEGYKQLVDRVRQYLGPTKVDEVRYVSDEEYMKIWKEKVPETLQKRTILQRPTELGFIVKEDGKNIKYLSERLGGIKTITGLFQKYVVEPGLRMIEEKEKLPEKRVEPEHLSVINDMAKQYLDEMSGKASHKLYAERPFTAQTIPITYTAGIVPVGEGMPRGARFEIQKYTGPTTPSEYAKQLERAGQLKFGYSLKPVIHKKRYYGGRGALAMYIPSESEIALSPQLYLSNIEQAAFPYLYKAGFLREHVAVRREYRGIEEAASAEEIAATLFPTKERAVYHELIHRYHPKLTEKEVARREAEVFKTLVKIKPQYIGKETKLITNWNTQAKELSAINDEYKSKGLVNPTTNEFLGTQQQADVFNKKVEEYEKSKSEYESYKPHIARQIAKGTFEGAAYAAAFMVPGLNYILGAEFISQVVTHPVETGKGFYEVGKREPYRLGAQLGTMALAPKYVKPEKVTLPSGTEVYSIGFKTGRKTGFLGLFGSEAYTEYRPFFSFTKKAEGGYSFKRIPELTLNEIVGKYGKGEYISLSPLETKIVVKSLEKTAPEEIAKIVEARGVRYFTIRSGVKPSEVRSGIIDILDREGIPNKGKVADTIIESLKDQEAELYGSLVQQQAGKAIGKVALERVARDIDVHVLNPESFAKTVTERINSAAGKRVVVLREGTPTIIKSGQKLFDIKSKEISYGYGEEFIAYGLKAEKKVTTKEGLESITLSEQMSRKLHGGMRVYADEVTLEGEGAIIEEVTGHIAPSHPGRIKDIGDFYFGEKANIAGLKLKGKLIDASRANTHLERWLDAWGSDAANVVRNKYQNIVNTKGEPVLIAEFGKELPPVNKINQYIIPTAKVGVGAAISLLPKETEVGVNTYLGYLGMRKVEPVKPSPAIKPSPQISKLNEAYKGYMNNIKSSVITSAIGSNVKSYISQISKPSVIRPSISPIPSPKPSTMFPLQSYFTGISTMGRQYPKSTVPSGVIPSKPPSRPSQYLTPPQYISKYVSPYPSKPSKVSYPSKPIYPSKPSKPIYPSKPSKPSYPSYPYYPPSPPPSKPPIIPPPLLKEEEKGVVKRKEGVYKYAEVSPILEPEQIVRYFGTFPEPKKTKKVQSSYENILLKGLGIERERGKRK